MSASSERLLKWPFDRLESNKQPEKVKKNIYKFSLRCVKTREENRCRIILWTEMTAISSEVAVCHPKPIKTVVAFRSRLTYVMLSQRRL